MFDRIIKWFKREEAPRSFWLRVADGLRLAATLMNDGGTHWTTHTLMNVLSSGDLAYCLLGGVNAAFDVPQMYVSGAGSALTPDGTRTKETHHAPELLTPAAKAARLVLASAIGGHEISNVEEAENRITRFNDSPTYGLTKNEAYQSVAAKLEEAAQLAEQYDRVRAPGALVRPLDRCDRSGDAFGCPSLVPQSCAHDQREGKHMPAYFEQGFMVREPAWHGLGVVLEDYPGREKAMEDYPGREKAMELAGHDFRIVECPVALVGKKQEALSLPRLVADNEHSYGVRKADGWKALITDKGALLNIARESYGVVQNDVPWDIVDAIVAEPNVKYESGGVLKGGALCWVLAWLTEPVTIKGDNSPILPFICASWTHDGSGAVRVRSTSVRVVCANTESASEAEASRLGTDFTFRHTKNVGDRIAQARDAITGVREGFAAYVELANELADTPITHEQRELFVTSFLPMPMSGVEISDRVANNVEEARGAVRALFGGQTIPEAHRYTAYGLHLAGVEYLDHIRGYRNDDTRFGRSLLRDEPAKAKLSTLIRETIAA